MPIILVLSLLAVASAAVGFILAMRRIVSYLPQTERGSAMAALLMPLGVGIAGFAMALQQWNRVAGVTASILGLTLVFLSYLLQRGRKRAA